MSFFKWFFSIPYLFSGHHIVLLILSAVYIYFMCKWLKKRTFQQQFKIILWLNIINIALFAGRIFWGWNPITKPGVNLLPLNLCNINIGITLYGTLKRNKNILNFLYFVSVTGAILSLVIISPIHMVPRTIFHYMFFDYYIIHTNLVGIPIMMIACGWFKPEYDKIPFSTVFLLAISIVVFAFTVALRYIPAFVRANYMWVLDPDGMPLLQQLYNVIPLPFVYQIPLLVFIIPLFMIMAYPFERLRKNAIAQKECIMNNEE